MPGINEIWQRTFGEGFGYSPDYMQERLQAGRESIGREFDTARRGGTANLSARGFYSARPMGRMLGQMGAQQGRAVIDYERGLKQESEQLGQQQKGMLFQGLSAEEMAEKQQSYTLVRMAKQQQYTVENLSTQQRYTIENMLRQAGIDESLMELQAKLGKSNFWDFVGNVIGQGLGIVAGGLIGGPAGAVAGATGGGYNNPHGST